MMAVISYFHMVHVRQYAISFQYYHFHKLYRKLLLLLTGVLFIFLIYYYVGVCEFLILKLIYFFTLFQCDFSIRNENVNNRYRFLQFFSHFNTYQNEFLLLSLQYWHIFCFDILFMLSFETYYIIILFCYKLELYLYF